MRPLIGHFFYLNIKIFLFIAKLLLFHLCCLVRILVLSNLFCITFSQQYHRRLEYGFNKWGHRSLFDIIQVIIYLRLLFMR